MPTDDDRITLRSGEHQRVRFGMERHREDSPCPACGTYYGDVHQIGCEVEECPACGGQLTACSCSSPEDDFD